MKKRELFLSGISSGACKKRAWVNSFFTLIMGTAPGFKEPPVFDFAIRMVDDVLCYFDPKAQAFEPIEDWVPGEALARFRDEFILNPGDIANYSGSKALVTTYGNVLVNQIAFVLPFGSKYEFVSGPLNLNKVEDWITRVMIDNPDDDDGVTPAPGENIYVREYLKFCDYILSLVAYNPICVASVTRKSLRSHPDRDKRRAELIAEHKDNLSDPSTVALLAKELGNLDYEWLKDDPSLAFYLSKKGKLFDDARRRQFYTYGGESPFEDGTTVTYIAKSLDEGIDVNHMDVLNNSVRAGSYNRGNQTKKGGEEVKTIYRMLSTARIIMEDCGTTNGIPVYVDVRYAKRLIGYYVIVNGESQLVTEENANSYVGQVVERRSAHACKAGKDPDTGAPGKGKNVCAKCMGTALAQQPNGLAAASAALGGRFLTLFLKKMHASSLKTQRWIYHQRIH